MATRYEVGDRVVIRNASELGWNITPAEITDISHPTQNETYYKLRWSDGLTVGVMRASSLKLVARKGELESKGYSDAEWEINSRGQSIVTWRPKNPDAHDQKVKLVKLPKSSSNEYKVSVNNDRLNSSERMFDDLAEANKAVYATLLTFKTGEDLRLRNGM